MIINQRDELDGWLHIATLPRCFRAVVYFRRPISGSGKFRLPVRKQCTSSSSPSSFSFSSVINKNRCEISFSVNKRQSSRAPVGGMRRDRAPSHVTAAGAPPTRANGTHTELLKIQLVFFFASSSSSFGRKKID